MEKVEILMEIVAIYEKYFTVITRTGLMAMTVDDAERLAKLREQLNSLD